MRPINPSMHVPQSLAENWKGVCGEGDACHMCPTPVHGAFWHGVTQPRSKAVLKHAHSRRSARADRPEISRNQLATEDFAVGHHGGQTVKAKKLIANRSLVLGRPFRAGEFFWDTNPGRCPGLGLIPM